MTPIGFIEEIVAVAKSLSDYLTEHNGPACERPQGYIVHQKVNELNELVFEEWKAEWASPLRSASRALFKGVWEKCKAPNRDFVHTWTIVLLMRSDRVHAELIDPIRQMIGQLEAELRSRIEVPPIQNAEQPIEPQADVDSPTEPVAVSGPGRPDAEHNKAAYERFSAWQAAGQFPNGKEFNGDVRTFVIHWNARNNRPSECDAVELEPFRKYVSRQAERLRVDTIPATIPPQSTEKKSQKKSRIQRKP